MSGDKQKNCPLYSSFGRHIGSTQTAVDKEVVASHVARLVTSKKECSIGHLARLSKTALTTRTDHNVKKPEKGKTQIN